MENITNILDLMEQRDKAYKRQKSLDGVYVLCGALVIIAAIAVDSEYWNILGFGIVITFAICANVQQYYKDKIKKIEDELPDHVRRFIGTNCGSQSENEQRPGAAA